MEKNTKKPYSAEDMATKPAAEVIDVVALGKKPKQNKNKTKPVKPSDLKLVMPTPIKQDIVSLFNLTPEALASIVKRWRDAAGHRAIGRAKANLLRRNPSPALVRHILDGATRSYDDSELGGIDSRVLYTELAKCINSDSLRAAIDSCILGVVKLEFGYDEGELEAGKMSAAWVLHPVIGENVLTMALMRYSDYSLQVARRDAMLAMMAREPNRLIEAVLSGRVSKQSIADLKTWKPPFLIGQGYSTIWTKVALVRAALWPEDMLKEVTRKPETLFHTVFDDSRVVGDTVLHWWPTRTGNSKSVYEEGINGDQLHYFELMLVTAMGALFDKYDRRDHDGAAAIIDDKVLTKLPHVKDIYFNMHTWRNVLTLAYRHEHMERIVHHLAHSWKGFAQAALTDETIDWLAETVPRMRGRLPDIINRAGGPNRQGKATRLVIMLRTIYQAADCEVEEKSVRASMKLSKWIKHGTVTAPNVAGMETARQFFLPKDIMGNLVTDDMVMLAVGLKADSNAARDMVTSIDTDVLRGLLAHANTEFVMYLYALDPVLMWAIEYTRAFTNRSKQTQDKIRAMLPAWLLGVTETKKTSDTL